MNEVYTEIVTKTGAVFSMRNGTKHVNAITPTQSGFKVELSNGEVVKIPDKAIDHYIYRPPKE